MNSANLYHSDISKALTTSLFTVVKLKCVLLSLIALLPQNNFDPNAKDLVHTIHDLKESLYKHKKTHTSKLELYYLAANFADYVFFPISGLLKQRELSDGVKVDILDILSFLIANVWVPNGKFDEKLVDQLLPVILFLIKGNSRDIENLVSTRSDEFNRSSINILSTVINLMHGYFNDEMKRLSMLGDIFSIVLSVLKGIGSTKSLEDVENILKLLRSLCVSISPDNISKVFPGTLSTIINFAISSKNLHFEALVSVIDLIRLLIVKVFSDEILKVEVHSQQLDLEKLNQRWINESNATYMKDSANVSLHGTDDKSEAWLKANATKLKISLQSFFKALYERQNNSRINKPQVTEAIMRLVGDILEYCYWSLFDEILPLCLDIVSLLCYERCYTNQGTLKNHEKQVLLLEMTDSLYYSFKQHDTTLLQKVLLAKVEDLINDKLLSIFKSSIDDRILKFLISLEVHLLLTKKLTDENTMSSLIHSLVLKLRYSLVDLSLVEEVKLNDSKTEFLKEYQGANNDFEDDNKLDDIQLPPYINANSITNTRNNTPQTRSEFSSELVLLSKNWTLEENGQETSRYFAQNISGNVEQEIEAFVSFLRGLQLLSEKSLTTLETLLLEDSEEVSVIDRAVCLWIANKYLQSSTVAKDEFKIEDFLDFGDDDNIAEEDQDDLDEMSYLLVSQSQEIISEIAPMIENLSIISSSQKERNIKEMNLKSYAIALDSLGMLSNHLPLDNYKELVLIEYLFPVFEAVTMSSNPHIQTHAKSALVKIANSYYDGSLTKLIMDNLDYLVDSLSLRLSVPGSVTPSIPGILLVILKVSGLELLFSNQLTDLISQIFVLIDSYHGYSFFVSGFFVVFEELIRQLKEKYLTASDSRQISFSNNLYKPWGLTNMDQVKALVDDSCKLVDSFEGYDRNKEYFHRKKDAPFAQLEADSDDEEEGEEETEAVEEEEKWSCIIPKNIYMLIQQVFIYGLRLLSHPSDNLKIQLLKTLTNLYPLLSLNYPLVLPIVADNWTEIISLFPQELKSEEVTVNALNLLTIIIETDNQKEDSFFSKRYLDLCTMILERFQSTRQTNELSKLKSFKTSTSERLVQALRTYLITGLNNYERIVPDITSLKIMKLVSYMGTSQVNYGKQAKNIAWVLRN